MPDKTTDISNLVRKAQSGDGEALHLLLDLQRTRLLGRLGSQLDDAEGVKDIVQNTLVRIAKFLSQYDPHKAQFNTWVNQIALNELRRWLRTRTAGIVRITINPESSDKSRMLSLQEAQTALNNGSRVRFEVARTGSGRDEMYRAEDIVNDLLAALDSWGEIEIPFMKFDDKHFVTQVTSSKAKKFRVISLDRGYESGNDDSPAGFEIPVEPPDVDEFEADPVSPVLHELLVSLVAQQRLLRLTCEQGGYPWQVVAFFFNKLFVWKPARIAKELSDKPLRSTVQLLESLFSQSFHHALERLVEPGVRKILPDVDEEQAVAAIAAATRNVNKEEIVNDFEPLRKKMHLDVKSVLDKADGSGKNFLAHVLDDAIGETSLGQYLGSDRADSISKLSDKTRKRVVKLAVAHLKQSAPSYAA